ncbi:RES family NAD+ phosphorylase [Noviherbaspirillum pedocola]
MGAAVGHYRADDLSGAAAARVGGRYNSIGTAVVYASANAALTVLETLVHLSGSARTRTGNRYLIEIAVPDAVFDARQTLRISDLRRRGYRFWDAVPFTSNAQRVGDRFVMDSKAVLLELPSAILPHKDVPDVNYLINPAHPDFRQLKIVRCERFVYDPRL